MKQESISLWKKRIADKKASGLKLTEWCEQNQLTTHAYYYWNRKISDMNRNGQDAPLFVEIPTSASAIWTTIPNCPVRRHSSADLVLVKKQSKTISPLALER